MKKIFILVFLLAAFVTNAQVRISQVYGGGNNTGATYNQDFVELFNAGTTSVSVAGWSVQYASAAGTAWAVAAIPASNTIPAGGYYLIALGSAGSTGSSLPSPNPIGTNTINLSASSGKVALVNNSTALSGASACSGGTVVDVLGYGAGSCFEGTVLSTTGITNVQSMLRKNNGCTDANNNNNDFTIGSVTPRNSSSPTNLCTSPTLTATPNITGLATTIGTASASQSFNVTGSNLTPATGNVTLTPTAGLEISLDNNSFAATQTVPYTVGTLASTPVYVRIDATAPQGALTGANITASGGGATNAVVTVAGAVTKNYYSNANGALNVAATWGDNLAGTTNAPTDFTVPYSIFNIVNRSTTMLGGPIDVSGTGSRIVIGDGTNPITVTTTITDSIRATNTVDVKDLAVYNMGNKVAPIFGTLSSGSTVDYSYAGTILGTDSVSVNAANYHNLRLTNGLKYLKPGITTVNGNFTMDATVRLNGAGTPFSTLVLKGNLAMDNNAAMEDTTTATGFANRFTLTMAGNGNQKINTGTSELRLFRLQRDTTFAGVGNVNLELFPTSKLLIGNNSGGDLKLTQKISVTPTLTTFQAGPNAQIAFVRNGSMFTDANGKAGNIIATNANIIMNKSITSTTINPGTLLFSSGSSLNDLTVNITTPTKDSLIIGSDVTIVNNLNLTKGVIVMATGKTLSMDDNATHTGGTADSYVDGNLKRNMSAGEINIFPVGQGKQFSPTEIKSAIINDFTVKYNKQAYSNLTINSTSAVGTYHVSGVEHWLISNSTPNSADVKLYYNASSGVVDPTAVTIAHFNGTDWDNSGRTANGSDANGTYVQLNGISNFSPFTFGGPNGVLPIRLESFTGTTIGTTNNLAWQTSCEDAGDSFELQYSADGINFNTIYNTDAIGNCNGNLYKYLHTNTTAAANYYRLKMIATNGRILYSNIVVLKNGKTNFETKIVSSTNGTTLGYCIQAPVNGLAAVQIVNVNGQKMYNKAVVYNNGYQINYVNISAWSNGVYILQITNQNGNIETIRFVK